MKKIHLFWLLLYFALAMLVARSLIFEIGSIHFINLLTGLFSLIEMILAAYVLHKIYLEKKNKRKNNMNEK